MSDDRAWDEQALTSVEQTILAYRAAVLALSTGSASYSLDTGQTRQSVTKANLTEMRRVLSAMESERKLILQRLGRGGGSTIARPEF